jgi:hypothetical protein
LENPLALKLLSGEFSEGDLIRVDRGPDGLIFTAVLQAQVVEE